MNLIVKAALVVIYPLLMLGRLLNRLLGRDPLGLEPPPEDQASFWIERGPAPSRASYFADRSENEGLNHGGFGHLAAGAISRLAAMLAPSSRTDGRKFHAAADRDKDIPDEVYTLW